MYGRSIETYNRQRRRRRARRRARESPDEPNSVHSRQPVQKCRRQGRKGQKAVEQPDGSVAIAVPCSRKSKAETPLQPALEVQQVRQAVRSTPKRKLSKFELAPG